MKTTLDLSRPLDALPGSATAIRRKSLDGIGVDPRPVLARTPGGVVAAAPQALPFPTGSIGRLTCRDTLEHVRDDDAVLAEFARVLAPGGRLRLRVPSVGPHLVPDALNTFRYVADLSFGRRPPETDEIGWRRHYPIAEIIGALEAAGFTVLRVRQTGTGLPELADLLRLALFRWVVRDEDRYARAGRMIGHLTRIDERLPLPLRFGFWLIIEAERR